MQAAPANLALRREALAGVLRDFPSFPKRLRDLLRIARRVLIPMVGIIRGIDPDHPILPHAVLVEQPRDAAGLFHREDKFLAIFRATLRA